MHAKTLIPGTRPIPALLATSDHGGALRSRLLDRGWVPFGQPLQRAPTGELRIGVDRLQVVVEGDVVVDGAVGSASPEGWWSAVDTLGGHCVVVLVGDGAGVDLTRPDAGDQLVALLGTDHAVSAALPVVTDLAG